MEVTIYRASGLLGDELQQQRLELEATDPPATVRELVRRLRERHGLALVSDQAQAAERLRPGVTVAVNRRDIEALQGLETPLGPEDEVAILGELPDVAERPRGQGRRVVLHFQGPLAARWGAGAGARHEVALEGERTLRAVLEAFSAARGAALSDWLLEPESGDLRPLVRVAVNDRFLHAAQDLDIALAPGDQVVVIQFITALAGG